MPPEDLRTAYEKVSPYENRRGKLVSEQWKTRKFLEQITQFDRKDARRYGLYLADILAATPGIVVPKSRAIPPLSKELEQYWKETVEQGSKPRLHRCFAQQFDRIPLALVQGVSLIEHSSDYGGGRQEISNDPDESYWVCDILVSDDPTFSPGEEYRHVTPPEAACIFAEFPQFGSLRGTYHSMNGTDNDALQVFFTSETWNNSSHADVHEGHLIADAHDPILDYTRRDPCVKGGHHIHGFVTSTVVRGRCACRSASMRRSRTTCHAEVLARG